jgi:hypothetical protein
VNLLDRLLALSVQWKRPISMISVAWFVLTCAAHARFIALPKLELLTDRNATIAAGAWNAVWWGFLKPFFDRRLAYLPGEASHG